MSDKQTTRWSDRTVTITYGQITAFCLTWIVLDLLQITVEKFW